MITAGVDLSAEPKGTALAIIHWGADRAALKQLEEGADNAAIEQNTRQATKVGIDCAFGWPDEFVQFITRHASNQPLDAPAESGIQWRRRLAYRETDRAVHERTGRWPLSVATDRLGLTAIRCAVLLELLQRPGEPTDRTGRGLVVEVYPAATLRCWGFDIAGYKTDRTTRSTLVDALLTRLPWLDLGPHEPTIRASDDALDALVAALAARASATHRATTPPPHHQAQAAREGWIALPLVGPEELLG
jgi:predicted nuclease with RNAse H fold